MLQVFDPPMCCSTGVCGPDVDPQLVAFANDLKWLNSRGISVERFNLSQIPEAFVENSLVYETVTEEGTDILPIILFQGRLVSKGRYLAREELASLVGLPPEGAPARPAERLITSDIEALLGLAAAVACSRVETVGDFLDRALAAGISRDDIIRAFNLAQDIREGGTRSVLDVAASRLSPKPLPPDDSCCGNSDCC